MPEHVANSKTRRADDFERCRLEITSAVNCHCNETTAQVDTCVQAKLGQFSLMNWQVNSSQSGYRFSCSSIPCPPPPSVVVIGLLTGVIFANDNEKRKLFSTKIQKFSPQ